MKKALFHFAGCALPKTLHFLSSSAFASKSQTIVLFFGVPGSGVGTFNNLLCHEFGLNQISLPEELRKIKQGNDYHIFPAELVDSIRNSLLIGRETDEILMRVVDSKLSEKEAIKGASIDGFPRTWNQFEKFEKKYPLNFAIHLMVDDCVLVEGMLGRRVCVKCHHAYNICHIERNGYQVVPVLPKKEGICDNCGSFLTSKAEDNVQTIVGRINRYKQVSQKMVDYLYKKYKVLEFAPKKGVKDFEILKKEVKNALAFI